MSRQEHLRIEDIIDAAYDDHHDDDPDGWDEDDGAGAVLRGDKQAEASHAGGELYQLMEREARDEQEREQGCGAQVHVDSSGTDSNRRNSKKRYKDGRTRRDRILRRTRAFDIELEGMVDAYLLVVERFGATCDPQNISGMDGDIQQGTYQLMGVDVFSMSQHVHFLLKLTYNHSEHMYRYSIK